MCARVKIYFAPTQFFHVEDISEMTGQIIGVSLEHKTGENLTSLLYAKINKSLLPLVGSSVLFYLIDDARSNKNQVSKYRMSP